MDKPIANQPASPQPQSPSTGLPEAGAPLTPTPGVDPATRGIDSNVVVIAPREV